jgi:excisionase family DNA binding protein
MISTQQAAKALGVTVAYIRRMAGQGRIPGAQRIGKVWVFPDQPRIYPNPTNKPLDK